MTRLPAIASLLLALVVSSAGCSDEASVEHVVAPAATASSSAVPDRTFAEPTEAAAATGADFFGLWWTVRSVKPPCLAAVLGNQVEVGYHGLVFPTQFLPGGYAFQDWEIEGTRLTATLDNDRLWENDKCIGSDLKAVLDCSTGTLTILVDGRVPEGPYFPVRILRRPRPTDGPCTY